MATGSRMYPGSSKPPRSGRGRTAGLVGLTAALALAAAWISVPFVASPTVTTDRDVESEISERVDDFVTERMRAHDIPGAAVAVVRAGEVAHLAGYGTQDPAGLPVTADTPFLVASVSKPLTATAVLGLVEDGVLSLDDPVEPYIADITDEVPEGFEQVTVEQLLTHTSGLGPIAGTAGSETVHQGEDALERRVADILSRPLSAEPGESFSYSNGGYSILAAVVEEATGTAYDDLMRERLFDPLGMAGSFASGDEPSAEHLATGHSRWLGRWRARELPYDSAGAPMGYIGSSAADLARFMGAHLGADDAGVLSQQVRDLAHRPAVAEGQTGFDDPAQAGYAMGWFVGEIAGRPAVSHSGELGHFTTHVNLVAEADGLGVAVLTNASAVMAGQGGNYGLSADLTALLLGEDVEPAQHAVGMTVVAPLAVWGAVIGLLAAAGRFLAVKLPRLRAAGLPGSGARRWLRPVALPAVGYLALAALLLAPLGLARHMAPDIGWGLTAIAYLAPTWALLRTALAVNAVRARAQATTPADPPATPAERARRVTAEAR